MTTRSPNRTEVSSADGMELFSGSGGSVLQTNMSLLVATIFGALAWLLWPGSTHWWALGLVSIAFGIVAFAMLAQAVRSMAKLYQRDKTMAAYLGRGSAPKSAKLASDDALRKAGMIQ